MRIAMMILFVFVTRSLYADNFDRQQIQQRISPVGKVRIQEAPTSKTTSEQKQKPDVKKRSGQAIYDAHCRVCHAEGLLGAPKLNEASDWKPRLAKAKTIDGLVTVAMKGLNAMPAKGTCEECSEADIKAAIEYMVPK